jgi:hypothetical protein
MRRRLLAAAGDALDPEGGHVAEGDGHDGDADGEAYAAIAEGEIDGAVGGGVIDEDEDDGAEGGREKRHEAGGDGHEEASEPAHVSKRDAEESACAGGPGVRGDRGRLRHTVRITVYERSCEGHGRGD